MISPDPVRRAVIRWKHALLAFLSIGIVGCSDALPTSSDTRPNRPEPSTEPAKQLYSSSRSDGQVLCAVVDHVTYCWIVIDGFDPMSGRDDPHNPPTDPTCTDDICRIDNHFSYLLHEGGTGSSSPPAGLPEYMWFGMNSTEQQMAIQRPKEAFVVFRAKEAAESWSGSQGVGGAHNGPEDALRHAMWSCLITEEIGATRADAWTTAHEEDPNQPIEERAMDINNNLKDRVAAADPAGCSAAVTRMFDDGLLTYFS